MLVAAPHGAAVSSAVPVSALIAQALRSNKDLQAARLSVDQALARLEQAGARPNPRMELSVRSDAMLSAEGEHGYSVGFSQDFPITDRIARQQTVARIDIDAARAEVADAERRLAGDVASGAYQLLVLDRQLALRRRLLGLDARLIQATQARFKAAEVSELDVNAARLDAQRLQQESLSLSARRAAVVTTLNTLLGRPAAQRLDVEDRIPDLGGESLDALRARALAQRQDLQRARLEATRGQAQHALANAQRWEDWSVGVSMNQDRGVVEGAPPQRPNRSIGLSLSIPLPLVNDNRGQMAEALAATRQAQARSIALQHDIEGEVSSAYAQVRALHEQLGHYRQDLFPLAERSVQLAQTGYAQGLASILEVMQAQRQLADVQAAYLDALDQYLQADVRLHTAVGDDVGTAGAMAPGAQGNDK
jgi:cobalt-zinc-cadmium efflux system outer membrane protein